MTGLAAVSISVPDGESVAADGFDALAAACRRVGFDLGDVLRLRIFYVGREQIPTFNEVRTARYDASFPDGDYPATTGVMVGTDSTGAGLRMEALLSKERAPHNTGRVPYAFADHGRPAFSHRVARADLACLSGQTALTVDADGSPPSLAAGSQAAAAARNALAVLADGGDAPADVMRVMVYVVGTDDRADAAGEVSAAYGDRVDVTGVLVDDLFKPGLTVEVETLVTPHGADAGHCSVARRTTLAAGGEDDRVAEAIGFAEGALDGAGIALADAVALTFWCEDRDLVRPLTDAVRAHGPFPTCTVLPMNGRGSDGLLVEVVARRS